MKSLLIKLKSLKDSLQNWFFTTWVGGLYFELLLWLDRRQDKPTNYLTPKEMQQVIRQYSLLGEGVKKVKNKVNDLVQSKTAEEYDKTLKEIENLMTLAERPKDSAEAKFAETMKQMYVKKGDKDIVTHTDRAKMIEDRIKDFDELKQHKEKREMLRAIRRLKKEGKRNLANKLEKDWKDKYGN